MRHFFSVCAALASVATLSSATTISYVDLWTTNTYNQTSSAQPTVSAGDFLTAHLYLYNAGDFSAANVTLPGGAQFDMALANSTTFQYQSPVLALSAFNNEFPIGDYTYTATGAPNQSVSIQWADDPDYSTSVPFVTDYASLQGMNSANAFDVTLNPFTNALPGNPCQSFSGSTCSYVFLNVYDMSGNAVFAEGYAPSSTTSFDIPAGTLQPGGTYTYSIIYSNQQVGSYDSGDGMYDPEYWSDVSTNGTFSTAASVTAPEPSTVVLFASGLALIVFGSRRRSTLLLAISLAACLTITPAKASYIMTLAQSGGNVVGTGSGTIDLFALTSANFVSTEPAVSGPQGFAALGPEATTAAFTAVSGPSSFGSGGFFAASTGSGDTVGISVSGVISDVLFLPVNYVSGASLSDSATWDNATIASLGLTPGTYTWTWGSGASADSFTVQIDASAPEPGSLALFGAGLIGLAALRRRFGSHHFVQDPI
jgi:PEP-CTERM motif